MSAWRSLTDVESLLIEALLSGAAAQCWMPGDYVVREIDEFGSLALRQQDREHVDLPDARLVASAYFDDGDGSQKGVGPLTEILLFETEGQLSELQIFRSDGLPIRRPIQADQIFMVTRR